MWTLKHNTSSPKFYELITKKYLKGETDLDLKNFYNHIKMFLNIVNRLQRYLLTYYQSIKRHSEFEEYSFPDRDHPYYYWNVQTCTSLGH